MSQIAATSGHWTHIERSRLAAICSAIVVLHISGWTLYLWQAHSLASAGGFAGAGVLAYVLGMRHAFDADHIAAIDDTTRLMMTRGRRPVGVGFFFALGHSSVVLLLALLTAGAAAYLTQNNLDRVRSVGGEISVLVATGFLLLVAFLNLSVLRGLADLWRRYRAGRLTSGQLDELLLSRGLMNRILGRTARAMIRSSWHMAPLGFLFGLGLETASEITLLGLSASTASGGRLPLLAVLSLPLLFAAGMTMVDTADSLLMSRVYSWANDDPGRKLYYNVVTTAVTVVVGLFVALVYLAGVLTEHFNVPILQPFAELAEHFELLGYVIGGAFITAWLSAVLLWKARYGTRRQLSAPSDTQP